MRHGYDKPFIAEQLNRLARCFACDTESLDQALLGGERDIRAGTRLRRSERAATRRSAGTPGRPCTASPGPGPPKLPPFTLGSSVTRPVEFPPGAPMPL